MLNQFKLSELIGERQGVSRFRGLHLGQGMPRPVSVIILREASPAGPPPIDPESFGTINLDGEPPPTIPVSSLPRFTWPGAEWERSILDRSVHVSLPRVLRHFQEEGFTYVIEEAFEGRSLLEAWKDLSLHQEDRFNWLIQIAEALHRLHRAGAVTSGVTPRRIIISASGQAMLNGMEELLPLPFPGELAFERTPYTAPEIYLPVPPVDPRADQFGFGATLYALYLGRDLTDEDFVAPGTLRPFLEVCPEIHPLIGRLVTKLTQRGADQRFPSLDRRKDDPTGMNELIELLNYCRANLDRVTLDISGWTTTGVFRTGNEDAITILTGRDTRLEDVDDHALLILADGMGGMESGEVASTLAVNTIREALGQEPPFQAPVPKKTPTTKIMPTTPMATEMQLPALKIPPATIQQPALRISPATVEQPAVAYDPEQTDRQFAIKGGSRAETDPGLLQGLNWLQKKRAERDSEQRKPDAHQQRIQRAIRDANQKVFEASRAGLGRGMGSTLEVVVIDGNYIIVGHVGDSRVYHYSRGSLNLVTQDQTFVFREVEAGRLTPEEAEKHPRRSELQQAVGGRVDIFPDFYTQEARPGDWLLLCSDGLSNAVKNPELESILKNGISADQVARRLVNLANQINSSDNVSVIVVRFH